MSTSRQLTTVEVLTALVDNLNCVKSRLFRITQEVDKAQRTLREVEEELYELKARGDVPPCPK